MPLIPGNAAATTYFTTAPRRIVSLVPSLTELLWHLGLDKEVIGITKFCTRPQQWFSSKQRVGGTKDPNILLIRSLEPEIIIASKEENTKEHIETLAADQNVLLTDINNLPSALQAIEYIGAITGKHAGALQLAKDIRSAFSHLPAVESPPRIAYFIWKNPYMVAGGDTFIHDMLQRAGFQNAFADSMRYPEVSEKDITGTDIRFLLLSSEPYPFAEKHFPAFADSFPGKMPVLVDGEFFSWYGSRLLYAPAYFQQLRAQVLSLTDAGRI